MAGRILKLKCSNIFFASDLSVESTELMFCISILPCLFIISDAKIFIDSVVFMSSILVESILVSK